MAITRSLAEKGISLKRPEGIRHLLALILATGFGVGYLPLMPGTWGAIAAVAGLFALYQLSSPDPFTIHLILTPVLVVLAVVSASNTALLQGRKDPSFIVIDEIAGQFLTLLFVPCTLLNLVLGLLLFRFFDILKPPPARRSECLPGGFGIVADDLIAGLYAGLLLRLIYAF